MKKLTYVIFSLFFLTYQNSISQNIENKQIEFEWQDNLKFKTFNNTLYNSFGDGTIIVNPLENNFVSNIEIQKNGQVYNVKFSDVIYEKLPQNYNFNKVTNTPNFRTKTTAARDENYLSIIFNPVVKHNNFLKRIISFKISFNYKPNNKSISQKSTLKQSALASGTWYKFAIDKSGVYKIDKDFLQNLGISFQNINPKQLQIYGNGGSMLPFSNNEFRYNGLQENSIMVVGENDGVFNDDDYILFYAQGPDVWKHTNAEDLTTYYHEKNIFSNEAYYFLTVGNSNGKRINTQPPINDNATTIVITYNDFTFYEKDEINLFGLGQQWFGEDFNISNQQLFTIPFKNVVPNTNLQVNVRGVASSGLTSSMDVNVNNQQSFTINYPKSSGLTYAVASSGTIRTLANGDNVQVNIIYNNNGNPSAKAYLDYIEVLGEKKLEGSTNQFHFRNIKTYNLNEIVSYKIESATNINQVWNITDALNPKFIENQSQNTTYQFNINSQNLQQFIAISSEDYFKPIALDNPVVQNQNLHSLRNIDYLIITPEKLENQAKRLANFHTNNSNLNTQVVRLNQIYNEFSSGAQDISAIRDFIKHLYDNSSTNKIKYVCLFGDASFDYKDRIKGNTNLVPAFESFNSFNIANAFVTDDFYGMMDANEGTMNIVDKQDVYTGRIPASNAIEAEQMVSKILNYYSSGSLGNWRTNITLVADDIDKRGEEIIQLEMEQMAKKITEHKPIFNLKKIYLDAYEQQSSSGGNRYPEAKKDIENQVEKGTLVVDYFGHGGDNAWAQEGILDVPTIQGFSNYNKLPLFITVTCEFAR
ncbi:MAG TPA: type IX secretion system sortase PorU, partial [Flavobacteriaceae bacterium]|nr:type IX secretion system sortase PorU [Flavobacteriaceae bacterium]